MNTETGEIHHLLPNETPERMADRLGIPYRSLTPLGNLPDHDCWRCKGTGIARIMASGRRVPCRCTNPV